ncbi:MAG: carboxypeptidase-like regulatory domain-containing protein [Lentimicrobiaceae bacterium]|jgi:hypothetical protein
MKTSIYNLMRLGIIILFLVGYSSMHAQNGNDSYVTVTGQLKDAKTGEKITYATISVPGTGIGTVSNSEGEFTLKVSKASNIDVFEVSHLSYTTTKFKISESIGKARVFYIEPQYIMLTEISIVPKDARSLVEMALRNVKKNYSDVPDMMTGFYRETIRQRREYVSISEAVVDIYKAAYTSMQDDQVKIFKGRKGTNVKKADTLMVQLQGGPNVSMLLDIVKNTDLSIALDNLDNYQFEFASIVNIDDKPNWIINFSPNVIKDEPLYFGKLYISQENMAITRAEFSLDLSDVDKASRVFVQRKPMGLIFLPTATSYLVNYKEQNGKYYLSYVRVDLKFRCDWKKRFFKNYYTIVSEVAITDRHEDHIARFPNKDVFRFNMVFADKVQNFTDPDFWGSSNIIEPEESIEHAIKRLARKMNK